MFDLSDESLKLLALVLASGAVRNTCLEDLHAGIQPESKIGDYSDVKVVTPYGEIPWNEVSRLNDHEIRRLMKEVVNLLYTHLRVALLEESDEEARARLLHYHLKMVAGWDEPEIDERVLKGADLAER